MSPSFEPIHLNEMTKVGNDAIPVYAVPNRVSLTINCLIPVLIDGQPYHVCVNFDPINWNQWYPIFTFHHMNVNEDFGSITDLIQFVEKSSVISEYYATDKMIAGLKEKCKNHLGLKEVTVSPLPLVDRDYWLKYSNTKKTWTLYGFYFFYATSLNINQLLSNNSDPNFAIIKLDDDNHEGIKVVENTVDIMRNPEYRQKLVDNAIAI